MAITSSVIRQQFIDFFKDKEHSFVRSSSVVPGDDPTLLFTNAGMNQFKPYFLGLQTPEQRRVANSQKCIRVSGKHNDLEEVGVDDYHHTFFEMLGNWSFGDYYKEDAIRWAWELLTEVWKLDKNRLWITIYEDDDESGKIWQQVTDAAHERILKFGKKDNFWEMGETGPCGPCSEIHYYTGGEPDKQSANGVNALADYREIWNLVFIQYNRNEKGELEDLPEKHVDTGAGFERIVAILNRKSSNYETDLFIPILDKIAELTGKKLDFKDGVPHRVIADHLRMLSFSIADGAMPGNEGRGYVLRRVLRRAARFGRALDMHQPFIYQLVETLIEIMSEAFPELAERQSHIEKVIQAEETSFGETLDRGLEIFTKITAGLKKNDVISGEGAFKLYDTYGFPLDLTELMAREQGLAVDSESFAECMSEQKERARGAGSFKADTEKINWEVVGKEVPTEFLGYDNVTASAKLIKYRQEENNAEMVLDRTCLYAEAGGQIGDQGIITGNGFKFQVEDVQKNGREFIHHGKIISGDISKVKEIETSVDAVRRQNIRLNHTATHLMHQALKEVLGDHVQQAGSLVAPDILRFDLTHYEALTPEQIAKIERRVGEIIRRNVKVDTQVKNYEDARKEGAVALFGEKYENDVRVVDVPGFSKELCGGTHVDRTGDIGGFKIISETALAAGVRRIVALTGEAVTKLQSDQESLIQNVRSLLKCSEGEIAERLKSIISDKKTLEKELRNFKKHSRNSVVEESINEAEKIADTRLIVKQLEDPGDLRELGDQFRQGFKTSGIAVIGTINNGKPMVMCAVTDDLTSIVKAGEIVGELGSVMGGGGGGKAHIATAGGKDSVRLNDALEHAEKLIKTKLSTGK